MLVAWLRERREVEIMVDIEVGGEVTHEQKGAKSTIGVASDQVVIYYDPTKPDEAMKVIDTTIQLHQFAKERKAGQLPPLRKVEYRAE